MANISIGRKEHLIIVLCETDVEFFIEFNDDFSFKVTMMDSSMEEKTIYNSKLKHICPVCGQILLDFDKKE